MPLTELIRHFNSAEAGQEGALYGDGDRAAGWYDGCHLQSLYQPLVDLRRDTVVGHQARLAARTGDGREIATEDLFARTADSIQVVRLDRLIRTLHTLNFLVQRQHAGGYLHLGVHPRHLRAVPSHHGLVFEAVLKRCGLGPEDIGLEIDLSAIADDPHLHQAFASYRERGYHLVLDSHRCKPTQLDEALAWRPEIVRLDVNPAQFPNLGLSDLVQAVHGVGAIALVQGIDDRQRLDQARQAGADLGQGRCFGVAANDCAITHSRHALAYNSTHPSSGVRT